MEFREPCLEFDPWCDCGTDRRAHVVRVHMRVASSDEHWSAHVHWAAARIRDAPPLLDGLACDRTFVTLRATGAVTGTPESPGVPAGRHHLTFREVLRGSSRKPAIH
jgi:hypothetical protein